MFSGTVAVGDRVITFSAVSWEMGDTVELDYTVTDTLTGKMERCTVPAEAFMCALSLAMTWDGDFPADTEAAWKLAESVQPMNPRLRFIP